MLIKEVKVTLRENLQKRNRLTRLFPTVYGKLHLLLLSIRLFRKRPPNIRGLCFKYADPALHMSWAYHIRACLHTLNVNRPSGKRYLQAQR